MAVQWNRALNGLFPILRRELGSYFRAPVASVYLVVFLLAALGCPFLLGNFYRSNHAGLELFFAFHPWLYLFLVPAMGMAVWAEEFQHSTILLLFTLPVSIGTAVVAKFLAAWIFLALALLLTFPIVATVFYLGNPDPGPILTGYLGSFLMAGVYLAVTTCTSALGRNQIVSYVLSTLICLVMVLLGQGALMDLLNPVFPVWLADLISQFSFSTHFHSLGLGVIDSRDIVYFASLIVFFLVANTIVIRVKMGVTTLRRSLKDASQLSIALVCVNAIAYGLPMRFDMTEDRAYTISESTRKVLAGIKGRMLLKFYFSRSNDQLSPEYKIYAQRVQDLLKEYVRLSDHRLRLEVIDPQPDTYEDEWAKRYGVQKTLLADGTPLYFGLAALMWDREVVISSFNPDRASQLEYDLTQRILRLSGEKAQRLAILGSPDIQDLMASHFSGLMSELQRSYDITFLGQHDKGIPKDVSLLLVIWTNDENGDGSDSRQAGIEEFARQGGRIFILADPMFRQQRPSRSPGAGFPYGRLLRGWGVQFGPNDIVGDLKNAGAVQDPGLGSIRYPFLIDIGPEGLSRGFTMTRTLDRMLFLNSGTLQRTDPPNAALQCEFLPLILSSSESASYDFRHSPVLQLRAGPNKPEGGPYSIGLFPQGAGSPSRDIGPRFSVEPGAADNANVMEQIDQHLHGRREAKILAGLINQKKSGPSPGIPSAIIVADADFVSDDLATSAVQAPDDSASTARAIVPADEAFSLAANSSEADPGLAIGGSRTFQQPNDNITFVLNAIDFLTLNDSLTGIRSRRQGFRDFTRVKSLERSAQEKFLEAERRSQEKLNEVKLHLKQTIRQRQDDGKFLLTEKQHADIRKYLDEESESRKELRSSRSLLRESIDALGNRLLLWNLLAVPLSVAFFGGVYSWRRLRRYGAGLRPEE